MNKFIGMFCGWKLFAEKEMPDKELAFMIEKLNKPGECLTLPAGWSYQPFQKAWVGLSDKHKIEIIRNAPNWTILELIEEIEKSLEINNA